MKLKLLIKKLSAIESSKFMASNGTANLDNSYMMAKDNITHVVGALNSPIYENNGTISDVPDEKIRDVVEDIVAISKPVGEHDEVAEDDFFKTCATMTGKEMTVILLTIKSMLIPYQLMYVRRLLINFRIKTIPVWCLLMKIDPT